MPARPSLPRRWVVALRWPVGLLLTTWSYLWRTTPTNRREIAGSLPEDGPPALPATIGREHLQEPGDGTGDLLRRRYRVCIRDARHSATELMAELRADPDCVAPGALAKFLKTRGEPGRMHVGDEFTVRMPGPWDGPIRVVEVSPRSFRFATLDGHIEAGQIEWRARDDDGRLIFEIESWSCPGDRLSHVMHHRLKAAKEVQLHMWTSVLEKVIDRTGGRRDGHLDIETRRTRNGV